MTDMFVYSGSISLSTSPSIPAPTRFNQLGVRKSVHHHKRCTNVIVSHVFHPRICILGECLCLLTFFHVERVLGCLYDVIKVGLNTSGIFLCAPEKEKEEKISFLFHVVFLALVGFFVVHGKLPFRI